MEVVCSFAIDRKGIRQKRHWALRPSEETPHRGVFTLGLCTALHPAARRRLRRRHYAPPLRRVVVRPKPQRMMRPVQTSRRGVSTGRTTTPMPLYSNTTDNFADMYNREREEYHIQRNCCAFADIPSAGSTRHPLLTFATRFLYRTDALTRRPCIGCRGE